MRRMTRRRRARFERGSSRSSAGRTFWSISNFDRATAELRSSACLIRRKSSLFREPVRCAGWFCCGYTIFSTTHDMSVIEASRVYEPFFPRLLLNFYPSIGVRASLHSWQRRMQRMAPFWCHVNYWLIVVPRSSKSHVPRPTHAARPMCAFPFVERAGRRIILFVIPTTRRELNT